MFYLPNGRPIDVEGAVDGMLDEDRARRYFLDTTAGEVGCVEAQDDQKLASIERERSRYRELPRASEEKQKELKGCEDCAICHSTEGGTGLHELLDAFEEQKQNDEDTLQI